MGEGLGLLKRGGEEKGIGSALGGVGMGGRRGGMGRGRRNSDSDGGRRLLDHSEEVT